MKTPAAYAGVTPKQLRILEFVQAFTAEHLYSPTLQEIADAIGVSTITILDHLRSLERRGIIRRQRYQSRSIEIVKQPSAIDQPPSTRDLVHRMLRVIRFQTSTRERADAISAAETFLAGGSL